MIKSSILIMWKIWKARNSKSFNGEVVDPKDIVNKALFDFHELKAIWSPHLPLELYILVMVREILLWHKMVLLCL